MKKLLLSCLLALSLFGTTQAQEHLPQAIDEVKDSDTLVVVFANEKLMVAYDATTLEKKDDVVSFTNLVAFNVVVTGPNDIAGAYGRTEINCSKQTYTVLTNHLVNDDFVIVKEAPTQAEKPINGKSVMRVLFQALCSKDFRESVAT